MFMNLQSHRQTVNATIRLLQRIANISWSAIRQAHNNSKIAA